MNVTLRQLRAFVAVAQSASFTEAASRLHVTQSALSGLIKEMEGALGVRVLHRSTRRVQLSEVGAEFLPLATRILQDLDQALDAITDIKALRQGVVRVAVPQLMACTLMPQVIAAFARKHPQVRVLLADVPVEAVQAKVRSGEVDLGVGPERADAGGVDARALFELPFVAVLPPDHALARRRRLSWADLAGQSLISLAGEYTRLLNADLAAQGGTAPLQPQLEVAYMTTALSMVSAGLGVTTCLPYAQSLIKLYGLKTRPLDSPQVRRAFHLFTRRDRKPSPAAQAFAEFLVGQAVRVAPR
jgi:DNA-binding transcriptional LysR family regulator